MSDPLAPSSNFLPDALMRVDRRALERDLRQIRNRREQGKSIDKSLARLQRRVETAARRYRQRIETLPRRIQYPSDLPISAHREDLLAAIRAEQVIILAGETGSGKTTQLPKLCLEAGRGVSGMIGHTQPRRLAAQAVASRLAEELGLELGQGVGFQVRFTDRVGPNSLIKLMTDGILLNEIQRDRKLFRYDTLIIDEAHERSLNIDFLLGYVKTLLPKRRDLRLIVTSATIDVARFSEFFANAPVFEVSGRNYPVDVQYRPPGQDSVDQCEAIVNALREVRALARGADGRPRDVLIFHSGEQEIRESALALRKAKFDNFEVLPLYSRLSQAEQSRVLRPRSGAGQRVVLSTNVAETSLTVPAIGYVIDPGLARISRYSLRSKVQQLPIEPISRASADQRKGRCGRLGPGVCIRLYSEDDYLSRAEFNEPEILRTNLASVVLQMHHLRLGDIARFPFIDPPDSRQINDGSSLLQELGALEHDRLTEIGRQLARLPIDPRLGRMLLAANQVGALQEMLVLASYLSIQDPRERPGEKQQAADQKHARFANEQSDFLAILNLWGYVESQRQDLSANQFRRLCKQEFLSWLRLREWRDVHRQLKLFCRDLNMTENREPGTYEVLHRALLAGLLSLIGNRAEGREFNGVRNRRFLIHPSSRLSRKPPKWVVCAELVETSRLYGRTAALIEPEWLMPWAEPLIKREYYEPAWRLRSARVMARERLRLYGLVIADGKLIDYGAVVPAEAREIFIQSALVEENFVSKQLFWRHNRALRAELAELEARGRRRDLVVEDRTVYEFYAERLPAHVCDRRSLDRWLTKGGKGRQQTLFIPRELLLRLMDHGVTDAQFPNQLTCGATEIPLKYRFEPGHDEDGVTAIIPLLALGQLSADYFDWLVPGLLRDKCIALLKSLPKHIRRKLVPIPDAVDELLCDMKPREKPLLVALAERLRDRFGIVVAAEDWSVDALEPFYQMNFELRDAGGRCLDSGRSLLKLQQDFAGVGRDHARLAAADWQCDGMKTWDCGELPVSISVGEGAAYPALVDQGDAVGVRVFTNNADAGDAHWRGVLRLLRLGHNSVQRNLAKRLLRDSKVLLDFRARFSREELLDDLFEAAFTEVFLSGRPLPRSADELAQLNPDGVRQLGVVAREFDALLQELGAEYARISLRRTGLNDPVYQESVADADNQLEWLLSPGFLARTPAKWRVRLPFYLRALEWRLAKLPARLPRDLEWTWEITALAPAATESAHERLNLGQLNDDYLWFLQEYRISLFAQHLGTLVPVSRRRLERLRTG